MSAPLSTTTIATDALSDADRAAWLALREAHSELESPYHHPDYHQLVHNHMGGGKLTLARDGDTLVAVLPWQGGRFARASGAPMSDYQTVIADPARRLGAEDLLHGQAVGAFHYTAMPSEADNGEPTARIALASAENWRAEQDGSYRRHLKSTRRRIRKAESEIGERRFVHQSRDIDAYAALMRWKSEKFSETGKYDVLANSGTSGLLRELWERGPAAELRADLHVLYFGDRIAACDLGITDGRVFHSWIVGYDAELLPYAPGIQLLEGVIDASDRIGYRVIDLGPGLDGYKRHYASHARHVAGGVVTLPSAAGALADLYDRAEDRLRERTGDALGKARRRYSQIAACEPRLSARSRAMIDAVASHRKGRTA